VTDINNNRIQKFNTTGTFLTKWGSLGSLNGQFDQPFGVAVDSTGNVYVADTANNRIQKFNSTGTFLTKWGSFGSANSQFNQPISFAVDSADNIYVTDTENDRVQKFDTTGTFLTTWGSFGHANGQFDGPTGVAVDNTDVYVVDNGNDRIQKFGVLPVLSLTKTVDNLSPQAGQRITYTLTIVEQGGHKTATNGVIQDNLPAGLTFAGPVSLEGTIGTLGSPPILASGLTISPGLQITVTFPVTVNANQFPGTIIRNTASISSAEVSIPVTSSQEIIITSGVVSTTKVYLPLLLKDSN
jgi:uncharacterized repeat protein (TIGR01451 family)